MTESLINDRGVSPPEPDKATHEAAGYVEASPFLDEKCALCEMYLAGGGCTAVEDPISPQGWCEFFEPERDWLEEPCTRSEMAMTGDELIDTLLSMPYTHRNIDNPTVDRTQPTPYGAGGSVPLENPITFIDPSVPKTLVASGVEYDPVDPWVIHENVEQRAMELLIAAGVEPQLAYRYSHFEIANVAENAWKTYHGIDPDEAEAVETPILDAIQHELIDAANANPALYLEPYPHGDEQAARHEKLQESPPTPEEIAHCRAVLCSVLGIENDEAPGSIDVRQETLDKTVRNYLHEHAGEIAAAIVKEQPTAGDVHATTALGNNRRRRKPGPLWKDPRKMKAKSFDEMISTAYWQKAEDDVEKVGWTDEARAAAAEARKQRAAQGAARHAGWHQRAGLHGKSAAAYETASRHFAAGRPAAGMNFGHVAQQHAAAAEGLRKQDDFTLHMTVTKADDEKQWIYGWASVSTLNGELVIDKQGDIIPVDELEKAAAEFVQYSRDMGDMHQSLGVGRMIASLVFTKELADKCDIRANIDGKPAEGWLVGFHVTDPESWRAIKSGERLELSIGGRASWDDA